jgi:hypothetical protein
MGEEFVSDDEFHETFEDITSTSGSDSADEGSGGHGSRMRATRVVGRPPLWSPSAFESKFSVWKDDPRSINERRQRFFREKGLKSSRDGAHLSAGFVAGGETASKESRNSGDEAFAGSFAV